MGKLDPNFIKPFVGGTIETLKVQCQIVATPGRPYAAGSAVTPSVDIAAIIGLTSKAFNGSIAICFPKKTFLKLMNAMLDMQAEEITEDFEDGAGELLNIIFGFAKRHLNDAGHEIQKAIPTVVRGQNLKIWHKRDVPSGIIPFTSTVGDFYIEVAIE